MKTLKMDIHEQNNRIMAIILELPFEEVELSREEGRGSRRYFTGYDHSESAYDFAPPQGFIPIEHWGNGPYRAVWVDVNLRAIMTWCEGDLNLEVFATDGAFVTGIGDAAIYYHEESTGRPDVRVG